MQYCAQCGSPKPEGDARCPRCGGTEFSDVPTPPMARPGMPPPPVTPLIEQSGPIRTSGLAIAALVCSLMCLSLPALIMGIIALSQIKARPRELGGQGLAVASIAISGTFMLCIPILAAIMFPVFAKARQKARQTTCVSQQRQIATAIQMYVQDNNARYPAADSQWQAAILPYVGSEKLYVCPAVSKGDGDSVTAPSYAANPLVLGHAEKDVPNPTTTIVIGDSDAVDLLLHAPDDLACSRHPQGAFVGFADGHVAAQPTAPVSLTP